MKYFYNSKFGLLIYPDNWWDVLRIWITRLLHPSLTNTWSGSPHWWKPSVHTVERKLEITEYPDEASA